MANDYANGQSGRGQILDAFEAADSWTPEPSSDQPRPASVALSQPAPENWTAGCATSFC